MVNLSKYSPYPGDKIPAVLEDGEYVLNRNAVKAIGKKKLDQINNVEEPRFAQNGGFMENAGFPTQNKFKLGLARKMARGGIATEDAQKRRNELLRVPNYINNYGVPTGNEDLSYNPEFREMNYGDNNELSKITPSPTVMDFMLQQQMDSQANPFNEREYLDDSGFINRNFKRDDGSDPTKPGGQLLTMLGNKYGKDAEEYLSNPEVARMVQENPYIHSKVENMLNSRKSDARLRADRNEPLTSEEISNYRINNYDAEMQQASQDASDLRETNYDIEMMNLGSGPSMFDYDAIEKRERALSELKAGMQRAKRQPINETSQPKKSSKLKERLREVGKAVEPSMQMVGKRGIEAGSKAGILAKDIASQAKGLPKDTKRKASSLFNRVKKKFNTGKQQGKYYKDNTPIKSKSNAKSNASSVKKSEEIKKKVTKKKREWQGPPQPIGPTQPSKARKKVSNKSYMDARAEKKRKEWGKKKKETSASSRAKTGFYQEGGMVNSTGGAMSGAQMNSRRLLNMAKRRKNVRG